MQAILDHFLFGIGPSTILKLKHETTAVVYSIVIHNILKKTIANRHGMTRLRLPYVYVIICSKKTIFAQRNARKNQQINCGYRRIWYWKKNYNICIGLEEVKMIINLHFFQWAFFGLVVLTVILECTIAFQLWNVTQIWTFLNAKFVIDRSLKNVMLSQSGYMLFQHYVCKLMNKMNSF